MKMRPYVLVIICALFINVYLTLFNSNLLYYVTFNMGMSETQASAMFTAMNIVSIVFIPFITKAVSAFSKTGVFVACTMFSGIITVSYTHLDVYKRQSPICWFFIMLVVFIVTSIVLKNRKSKKNNA